MSNQAERNSPVTRMRIDFISSDKVISRYPVVIRADGDLFRGIKSAFERLRNEHPTLNASDNIEVSVKYENEGPQAPGDRVDPEIDLLLDHQRHLFRGSQELCATSRQIVADSETVLVQIKLENRWCHKELSEAKRICRDLRYLTSEAAVKPRQAAALPDVWTSSDAWSAPWGMIGDAIATRWLGGALAAGRKPDAVCAKNALDLCLMMLAAIFPRFGGMRIFIDAESSERLRHALDILRDARLPHAGAATVMKDEHHYAIIVMDAEQIALAMQVLRGAGFKVWLEDAI